MARSPRAERAAAKRRRAAEAAQQASGFHDGHVAPRRKRRREPGAALDALVARFPVPAPFALALSLSAVVGGNAYLLWRVARGELSLTGIVLLVLAEAVLLSLFAWLQQAFVPAAHRVVRDADRFGLPQQAIGWFGWLFGVGGAYVVWAWYLGEQELLRAFLTSLAPWRDAGLHVALGITVLFALAGLVADHAHYRREGPPFVSSVGLEAGARRITFTYGALVVAIPTIGSVLAAMHGIPRLLRGRESTTWNAIGGFAVIGVFFGSFHLLVLAIRSGRIGWAAVYLAGKGLVEILFVLLPLLARRAAAKGERVASR